MRPHLPPSGAYLLTMLLCAGGALKSASPASACEVGVNEDFEACSPRWRVGALLGGGYNRLRPPSDPAGQPTLLYGSGFSGLAFQGGARFGRALFRPGEGVALDVDVALAYGSMRGVGFAERDEPEGIKRQQIVVRQRALRVPLMLLARGEAPRRLSWRAGLGAELLLGLSSGATVTFEQIDAEAPPLETTPTQHLGLLAMLGAGVRLSPRLTIPLEARLTWDPQVGDSTVERFEGFESVRRPGAYQIAFDLHLQAVTGLEWHF